MTVLEGIIKDKIRKHGPMSLADYMGLCLGHPEHGYYMTRDPLGRAGDFITAPEISQLFGELIGAWLADSWVKLDMPEQFTLLECGPGRGTLMSDALGAVKGVTEFHEAMSLVLLETSPVLKKAQEQLLSDYNPTWCSDLGQVPTDSPLIVIGNEFLDALPVHQLTYHEAGWREKTAILDINDTICLGESGVPKRLKPYIPQLLITPKEGDIVEVSLEQKRYLQKITDIIKKQRGICLFIDYGFIHNVPGDTLQGVRSHEFCSIFDSPGEVDITAHVNFGDLGSFVMAQNMTVHGPVSQSAFLKSLGIEVRAHHLSQNATAQQKLDIQSAVKRLCGEDTKAEEMGQLFKAIAFSSDPKLELAGF